jgi:hypothetical protein
MYDSLNRRCALFLLVAMTAGLSVGLIAWGPMPMPAAEHVHAGDATLFGRVVNVLATLPMALAALAGWHALRRNGWPATLTIPWTATFAFAIVMALASALYHLTPGDPCFVISNTAAAGLFMLLLASFLAERVHPWFGTWQAVAAVMAIMSAAGLLTAWCLWDTGQFDLRPLMLLQMLPVLLIPAGALQLQGRYTTRNDWVGLLGAYLVARALEPFDEQLLQLTGWIGGHALMHLAFAASIAWLARAAYRAGRTREVAGDSAGAVAGTATAGPGTVPAAQASTSLNTSG